ncbi:hypothetical protein SAMN04487895_11089 [Paenibacillus sophorae]|uniref:Uncharacterized protein n=1 Tax=Paenibacillus sophorae TaxID=1333845 RepID=A0A1H8RT49_9BACL|nr:hypothetical protein [Paenibacillus sophorae]QWU16993.1 hypothetical protein KP014_07305 [Paenibacillus sophorae]SEO69525.1 hypothetical protein SAMN04487895_11089 [Paenibacillus sophorae]
MHMLFLQSGELRLQICELLLNIGQFGLALLLQRAFSPTVSIIFRKLYHRQNP